MADDMQSTKRKGGEESGASRDAKVMRMMKNMGYTTGKGLGKSQQGRVEPIESSLQQGRRGLGHTVKGFERDASMWQEEEITVEEIASWLPACTQPVPDIDTLQDWKHIGPKKESIDDESTFCSQEILTNVLSMKSEFDNLEAEEMRRARTRSNPYETIRGAFFLNRAAMKMANMDAVYDFMFTKPKDKHGKELYPIENFHPGELMYFADMCAGPGGFSEYVLWRRKGQVKGFGFTLRSENDFKLTDFHAGPSEMFEPHYGVGGYKGDGDIYNPDNQQAFREFVFNHTHNKGVNFALADGGFSVEGEENIQEIRSKRLYLCQCLTAMLILRPGGHFLCKLFDLFTRFSMGLVYLMYRAFDQVSIFKPVTSRPANSERYIICKGMRTDCDPIKQYLHQVNLDLDQYLRRTSREDVTDLVPLDILNGDQGFMDYMVESNEIIAELQVLNLKKIQTYAKNPNLYESRQADIRKICHEKWEVPLALRSAQPVNNPQDRYETLTRRTNVFRWDVNRHRWVKLGQEDCDVNYRVKFELPPNTLIEAVICDEYNGEGSGQRKMKSVHVIDAYYLNGCDISHYSYPDRRMRLEKFIEAIHKPTRIDISPVKMTPLYRLERLDDAFERLSVKKVKMTGVNLKSLSIKKVKKTGVNLKSERLCYAVDEENYFYPTGVFFIKFISEPWMMAWSRSKNRKYYYNVNDHSSLFETPPDSVAPTSYSSEHTLLWSWEDDDVMSEDVDVEDINGNAVHKSVMMKYIGSHR